MSDNEFVQTISEDDVDKIIEDCKRKIVNDLCISTMSYVHGFVNAHTKASIAVRERLEEDVEHYVTLRFADLKSKIL